MKRERTLFGFVLAGVLMVFGAASAQPEPWFHPDSTYHYYDAFSTPGGMHWYSAFDSAAGRGGYLATITSQAENDFIFGLVDSNIYWYARPGTGRLAGPWLGGVQDFGSQEPDSGWHWVTAETMYYRNWSAGEPDNQGGEDAVHFGESVGVRVPTWDDANSLDGSIRGFVRELSADSTTVGLRLLDSSARDGYTLFANNQGRAILLIDNQGRTIHSWRAPDKTVGALYLLENGLLSQIGNLGNPNFLNGGRVSLLDWDGNVVWRYDYSDSTHCLHHDAIWLPNGHLAAIAWERKTRSEAIEAGRDTTKLTQGKLWPEAIIEVDTANDSIVWEWHIWDHLIQDFDSSKQNYGVVGDHPELIDLNFTTNAAPNAADWIHANALDYNPAFDQLMFSARGFNEVWVIDHGTTTEQARGHTGGRQGLGGDLLYRWGNPQTYRAGDSTDQQFYYQHCTHWIRDGSRGAGNILVLDNGLLRPGTLYTTVQEFVPPVDSTGRYETPAPGQPYGPAAPCWKYGATPPASFYTPQVGSAQRLPNGNTLMCEGTKGRFFEVGADSQVVWTYINPVIDTLPLYQGDTVPRLGPHDLKNIVHRSPRYAPDYAGLVGRDLTPGYPLERYRTRQMVAVSEPRSADPLAVRPSAWPNPFARQTNISFGSRHANGTSVDIFAVDGRLVRTLVLTGGRAAWDGRDDQGRQLARGVYYCGTRTSRPGSMVKVTKLD